MKRMYVNLTEQQIAALKTKAEVHGSPTSEEIRRAVSAWIADSRQKVEYRHQPVLVAQKESALNA
jgi:hypothetical protein